MIIVRLLSPGPWLVGTTKVYSGVGADIVMESITLRTPVPGILSGDFSSTTDSRCAFSDYERKRPTSRPAFGLWLSPLLALYQRAVGRSRFPCAGIIDPGVAADNGSRP